MNRIEKMANVYKGLAVMLLNIVVLFAGLNLIALVIVEIDDALEPSNPVEKKYSYGDALKAAYTWLDKEQMDELLRETWSRPVIYEAYTQFKERPYEGKYVNVSDNGFRHIKDQGPWPPASDNFNVFVFGGYTVARDGSEKSLPNVDILSVASSRWSSGAAIPVPTDDAVSGVWRDSLIYLVSGWHDHDNISDVQIYDTTRDSC